MIGLDFLGKVEVFRGLSEGRLAAIQAHFQEESYPEGDRLFTQDAEAGHLWVVVEGSVNLHFERPDRYALEKDVITTVTETMPFGWSSVVEPFRYRYSAFAASSTCRVIRLEKEHLSGLLKEDTQLGYTVMSNLTTVIARRFHQLQGEMAKHRGDEIISNW
jgi:CRP-like cAMP-binding protein